MGYKIITYGGIMGFMGGIFRALGFEGEKKIKTKVPHAKASFKLKQETKSRIDEIDGVSVYYPENLDQAKEFSTFVKQAKPIIVSTQTCDKDMSKEIVAFLKGFVFGSNSKLVLLKEELYLVLPEGVEVEE